MFGIRVNPIFKSGVCNGEEYLGKKGKKFPAKALTPLSSKYRPKVDISEELGKDEGSYYYFMIGVPRWIVELVRVDICCELSMMYSHLTLPIKRHLEEVLHMFAYLKSHANSEMVFDPIQVEFDKALFLKKIGVIPFMLKLQVTHKRHFRRICPNHMVRVWT